MSHLLKTTICLVFSLLTYGLSIAQTYNLLVGTYTKPSAGEGIYVYSFDGKTGNAVFRSMVRTEHPSFLALANSKRYLYAVNEQGNGKGAVSAFSYNRYSGELRFVDSQYTEGDAPCHISIDKKDQTVVVSNYSGGNLSVFGVEPNGTLSPIVQKEQYYGSSVNRDRQEKSHVHSAFFTPSNQQLLVQNLGTDKIYIYPFNKRDRKRPVELDKVKEIDVKPGSGPRHVAINKKGNHIYLVTEMIPLVQVYKMEKGTFDLVQEESIVESGFAGTVGAADIKLSPDGKFLYASNRGDANDMSIFSIDKKTGKLTFLKRISTLGKGPRNFAMTPDGKYLLVAHQYTNDVVVFARDKKSGLLEYTGKKIEVGAPVCLVFDKL
ncbi:lactonase family protein [Olivibacter sitiensis]|uniref:lactonase family protein n=1 Tax=Olivibacter sitiensis TaxID=376470 RepID=UPI00042511D5|nr:lactonase family protein [Olivibacter sitiensis]